MYLQETVRIAADYAQLMGKKKLDAQAPVLPALLVKSASKKDAKAVGGTSVKKGEVIGTTTTRPEDVKTAPNKDLIKK